MENPEDILSRLHTRYEILVDTINPDANVRNAIARTLAAFDNPHSHYVALLPVDRDIERQRWLMLAKRLGCVRKRKQSSRQKRGPCAKPLNRALGFFGDMECVPYQPLASNDLKSGIYRMRWQKAQECRYVELNPPALIHWIVIDCDHADVEHWRAANLPEPSFITITPLTHRHHVVYRLATAVCRSENRRAKPLRYLQAIQRALVRALKGDENYVGLMTKNPLHSDWRVIKSVPMHLYSLSELAARLDLTSPSQRKTRPGGKETANSEILSAVQVGSRNRALFDVLRCHAGQLDELDEYAHQCNALFAEPLPYFEVAGIVASIKRYRRGHRYSEDQVAHFCAKQSERGKKGGRPKTTSDSQPWVEMGISRSTWYRRLQKTGRSDQEIQTTRVPACITKNRPWDALGIARATWYRRRKTGMDTAPQSMRQINETKA